MSKLKKIVLFSGLTVLVLLSVGGVIYAKRDRQDKIDYDCSDFSTQQLAQKYFVDQGGSAKKNVDDLDANHNGIACESNPTRAPFSWLNNIDPNSVSADPNEPTLGDLSDPTKKTYTNPACLDANGQFDLNKAIQINGNCFSFTPY